MSNWTEVSTKKVRFDLQILAISEAQILNEVSSDVLPTNNNKF